MGYGVVCMTKELKLKKEEFKQKCLNYLGGKKCYRCKTENWCVASYQFHHKNPALKDFQISQAIHKPWKIVKEELDKCIVLCSNCHDEIHYIQERTI